MRIMKKLFVLSLFLFSSLMMDAGLYAQNSAAEDGKGTVIIYRKKKFSGSAITPNIQDSERNYGPIKNGGVLTIKVEPGERTFFFPGTVGRRGHPEH